MPGEGVGGVSVGGGAAMGDSVGRVGDVGWRPSHAIANSIATRRTTLQARG